MQVATSDLLARAVQRSAWPPELSSAIGADAKASAPAVGPQSLGGNGDLRQPFRHSRQV